jgi:tetratricopeptide (TPR) repeat protein
MSTASQSAEKRQPVRRWLVLLAAITIGTPLAIVGCYYAVSQVRAWQCWQRAQSALAADDLPAALDHLEQCAASWPNSAPVHFWLARVSRRLDDLSGARRRIQEARRCGYPKEELELETVLLLAQSGELNTTEETLQALLRTRHRDEPLLFEALITGYITVRDLRNAVAWSGRWIERQPDSWRAYYLRAKSLELAVQLEPALSDCKQVLALKSDHPEAGFKAGDLLRRLDQYEQALPYLEKAQQRDPGNPTVVVSLARCQRSLGKTEAALALLESWLQANTAEPAAVLMLMGRLELDKNRPAEALNWLRRAEEASPRDEETLHSLSLVFRELGQTEQAEKYAARAEDVHRKVKRIDALLRELRDYPQDLNLRCWIGKILLGLDQEGDGLRWLMTVLQSDASHRETHEVLADHYEGKGKLELARNHRLAAEGKLRAVIEP